MNRKFLLASFAFVTFLSCRHETFTVVPPANNGNNGSTGNNGGNCDPSVIYFQQQVLPLLVSNCTMSGCHDERTRKEGVILTSYTTVMNTGGVKSGKPSDSKLYKVLLDNDPDDRMPPLPAAPLTAAQKDIIFKWIQQGAQNLSCESACDASVAVTYANVIKPILAAKCNGCHNAVTAQGGIDLGSYNGVKSKINDGRLWGSINHQPGFSAMPRNGTKLSDCELAQFRKWIDAGSLNN